MNKFDLVNSIAEPPAVVSVLTTSTLVSNTNPNRLSETLCNISSDNIFLGLDVNAEVNKGIFLPPGSAISIGIATGIPYLGSIYAIAETGTSGLTIQRINRISGR